MDSSKHIPDQNSGGSTDTSSVRDFLSEKEAKDHFNIVKERLFNVNQWHSHAGAATAEFKLFDADGNEADRQIMKWDYFQIDIPGPGSVSGNGYDWVQVENIEEENSREEECITITVRPCPNPLNPDPDVAHFFEDSATSSFVIMRNGKSVSAEVHGRNEKPNTKVEKIIDKVRNATIAATAISGFSSVQWKALVEGLNKD